MDFVQQLIPWALIQEISNPRYIAQLHCADGLRFLKLFLAVIQILVHFLYGKYYAYMLQRDQTGLS